MCSTCSYTSSMATKMIQIRHVPSELHLRMKARAEKAGKSLSDFLLGELKQLDQRPTMEEWLERLERRSKVETGEDAADIIREMRGPL